MQLFTHTFYWSLKHITICSLVKIIEGNQWKFIWMICHGCSVTKKKKVWKHTAHWLPSTNLGVHVLLIYSTQFRLSISHKLLLTNLLNHLLHRNSLAARQRHDLQLSFYLSIYRFYQGWKHGTMLWYQKKRSETHSTLTPFNKPRRPCSPDLLHTVQTFDLTQHTNYLLTLSDEHYKIKNVQVLCFHTTTEQVL
jgi:hypothetical protein